MRLVLDDHQSRRDQLSISAAGAGRERNFFGSARDLNGVDMQGFWVVVNAIVQGRPGDLRQSETKTKLSQTWAAVGASKNGCKLRKDGPEERGEADPVGLGAVN